MSPLVQYNDQSIEQLGFIISEPIKKIAISNVVLYNGSSESRTVKNTTQCVLNSPARSDGSVEEKLEAHVMSGQDSTWEFDSHLIQASFPQQKQEHVTKRVELSLEARIDDAVSTFKQLSYSTIEQHEVSFEIDMRQNGVFCQDELVRSAPFTATFTVSFDDGSTVNGNTATGQYTYVTHSEATVRYDVAFSEDTASYDDDVAVRRLQEGTSTTTTKRVSAHQTISKEEGSGIL
jgi:hypothetical protein